METESEMLRLANRSSKAWPKLSNCVLYPPLISTINENIYSYYSKRHMFEALCLDNSHENQRRATTLPRVCDIVTQVPKPYWQARGKRLPPTGKPVPFPIPPNWYWSFT